MDEKIILLCPYCGGPTRPDGYTRAGKPRRWCDKCKRKFMAVAKRCVVCNKIIPRERIHGDTCSEKCFSQKRKTSYLNHYYKKIAEDPEFNKKRNDRNKERPEFIESRKAYYKVAWRRIKENSERLEHVREKWREFYQAHAAEIQAARKERLDSLSPEELADWIIRMREYSRQCSARYREERETNPEARAIYREKMREYSRKRKLAKLMQTMQELEDKQ